MFFKAISQFKPDLVIITGVHLLEFQVYITLIFHLTLRSFYLHSNIFYYIRLHQRNAFAYFDHNMDRLFFVKYWNYIPIHLELDAIFMTDILNRVSIVFILLINLALTFSYIIRNAITFLCGYNTRKRIISNNYLIFKNWQYFIYIRKHSSGKCCGNSTSEISLLSSCFVLEFLTIMRKWIIFFVAYSKSIIKINIKLVYFSLKQLYNALSTTKYLYIVYLYALLFRLLKCLTGCFAPLVVIEVILRQKTMATVSSESTFIISNISVSIKNHLHHDFMPFSKLAAYKYRYYLHKNLLNYEIIILL
uniref:DNA-directed DNA polymerase n=1 Tax=Heterorhabditis bacteriophora TaxID=37862 RepID=A0A1I7WKH6_HETBA